MDPRACRAATKALLGALPFRIDLLPEGRPPGRAPARPGARHAHVNTLYWTEDRPDDFCLKMAAHAGRKAGDVIAFGHTHMPWDREVEGIQFVNTGSVGRPKDGDWRAGYVVLDARQRDGEVEMVRVEYDLERAMDGIRKSELPDDFAEYLRTGGQPAAAPAQP